MPPEQAGTTDTHALDDLREHFPQFMIWRETALERVRYIARARDLSTPLHSVVTADLGELRAALAETAAESSPPHGTGSAAPNIARVYSYWAGGKMVCRH